MVIRLGASLTAGHSTRRNSIEEDLTRRRTSKSIMKSISFVFACSLVIVGVQAIGKYRGLEFLEPCSRSDYNIESCLARSANALTDRFRHGKKLLAFVVKDIINGIQFAFVDYKG